MKFKDPMLAVEKNKIKIELPIFVISNLVLSIVIIIFSLPNFVTEFVITKNVSPIFKMYIFRIKSYLIKLSLDKYF